MAAIMLIRGERRKIRRSSAEFLINELLITLAIILKIISGVGFLALTWSTVVLLGGFVGALQMKEFWFLTTVSLVLASTILTIYDSSIDTREAVWNNLFSLVKEINRAVEDETGDRSSWSMCFRNYFWRLLLVMYSILWAFVWVLIYVVLEINFYGPVVSTVISMKRLIQHDYHGSDAASKGKLRAALFIFYCLALAHGLCCLCWSILRQFLLRQLRLAGEQCGFEAQWGKKVINEYYAETNLKYANDLRLPAGWNLVAYAVGLLESLSRDDNLSGVRILDTFVGNMKRCIRPELLSSRRAIQSLISMLGWTSPSLDVQEIRERAARIMADISEELHIARFPGALPPVYSLLEARDQEASEQSSQSTPARDLTQQLFAKVKICMGMGGMEEEETAFEPKGAKELILQGLLILGRLAFDEHNCREIVNTPGLLSKECQIRAAEILEDYFRSDSYYGELSMEDVINILTKILRIIRSTEQNDEQSEERKLVAALLSLTVVIYDIFSSSSYSCFVDPVEELIEKLKDIIERNNDTTADCLRIVKLTCQVVIAMMENKPSCIEEFEKHDFEGVLSKALNTLSDLDSVLTEHTRSLASLVKEAHQLFNKAREPGNNSA